MTILLDCLCAMKILQVCKIKEVKESWRECVRGVISVSVEITVKDKGAAQGRQQASGE